MSNSNLSRRQFLESVLYSSLLYAGSSVPSILSTAKAMPAQVRERTLVDLFLDGGPDFRHLIVPAFSSVEGSYGQLYWQHRQRSHSLEAFGQTAEQRWNDDYYHITVGQENKNWANNLVDPGDLNSGIEFGILKSAGWLIDMFRAGNVALVFNAYGTTNRAHDLSRLVVKQGNVLATPNERLYSGWGGRLARSANSNCVSLISSPSIFAFGPTGSPNDYDPAVIDNVDVLAIGNSRELGLFDEPFEDQQHRIFNQKMARASKQYYAGIKQETVSPLYAKFFQHEENLRSFGDLLRDRLESVPIPPEIEALYSSANFYQDGTPNLNPDPETGEGREMLSNKDVFAPQIRNLYDILAVSDLEDYVNNLPDPSLFPNFRFKPRVLSMDYRGWDTHSNQRFALGDILKNDPENPIKRGLESGLRDVFGGQYGSNPSNPSALHCGLSALWHNLPSSDQDNIAITIAGEFGRQIRDNGLAGTDHGAGNLMLVIGGSCNGGIYGEMFPQEEIFKYQRPPEFTPHIDGRTEIDQLFSKVCDWVQPGSGSQVFPRMAESPAPPIELNGMLDDLFS